MAANKRCRRAAALVQQYAARIKGPLFPSPSKIGTSLLAQLMWRRSRIRMRSALVTLEDYRKGTEAVDAKTNTILSSVGGCAVVAGGGDPGKQMRGNGRGQRPRLQ